VGDAVGKERRMFLGDSDVGYPDSIRRIGLAGIDRVTHVTYLPWELPLYTPPKQSSSSSPTTSSPQRHGECVSSCSSGHLVILQVTSGGPVVDSEQDITMDYSSLLWMASAYLPHEH